LTAGALYDYVSELATKAGWEFGNSTAGHLIGRFPHEKNVGPAGAGRFSIRHDNSIMLRERDAAGAPRHWILEIHFVDRTRMFGGFFEELLTIGPA
jgi:Xaa-Pro dipeptidase